MLVFKKKNNIFSKVVTKLCFKINSSYLDPGKYKLETHVLISKMWIKGMSFSC